MVGQAILWWHEALREWRVQHMVFVLVLLLNQAISAAAIPSLSDLAPWQLGQSILQHPKACPPGWLWISTQQWWQIEQQTPPLAFDAALAQDSGHIHNELCWPQALPISGPSTIIKIQKLLHANVGYDRDYGVVFHPTTVTSPIVPSQGCPTSYYICNGTYITNGKLRYASNCAATGGVEGAQGVAGLLDCQWTDTLDINANALLGSDIVQAQFKARSLNPADNNREQRIMADLSAFMYNGDVAALPAFNPDTGRLNNRIAAEGWTNGVQYGRVTLYYPPKLPIGGVWRFFFEINRLNTNGAPMTSHTITLDPSFHANNPGLVLRSQPGPFNGQLTVNMMALKPGWHRIFALGKQLDPATNVTQTTVLGMLFEVAGGPQAGGAAVMAPGVPVMTHSTEFGPVLGSGGGYMQSEYTWYNGWFINYNYVQFDVSWFAAAGLSVQSAAVMVMHNAAYWGAEQRGLTVKLGAAEVLDETWTALGARNGRPPRVNTTRLVGNGTVTGDGQAKYRRIDLDPAFVNRKLRCDSSGRLSVAFFINENVTAPAPVPPPGVNVRGYGYRVSWEFQDSKTGPFLMLTPSPVPLPSAVPACN